MPLPIAEALADEIIRWLREALGSDATANPTTAYFLVQTLTGNPPEGTPSCTDAMVALMEFCGTRPSRDQMNQKFMTLFDMRTKRVLMRSWQSQTWKRKQPEFTLPMSQQLDASAGESLMVYSHPGPSMTADHRAKNAPPRMREDTPFDETAIEEAMRKQTNWKRRRAQAKQMNAKRPRNNSRPEPRGRQGREKWARDKGGRLRSVQL